MMDIHIDMNPEIQKLLALREGDLPYRAIVQGDPTAMAKLANSPGTDPDWAKKIARESKAHLGPAQVESFLRFVVDRSTERALEDAEADNGVYNHLGEHRVLGKKKCGKGNRKGKG